MKEIMEFKRRFKAAGLRQGWWQAPGLVAALSGGGDSVALLWLLHNFYPGRVVAAHLDHCTREGMSHSDAEFAKELCGSWGVECRVKVAEVLRNKKPGESFEMAGRRERYQHFRETAAACGLHYIAVGHSADDLVETQLLNLCRGTGLTGLRGIPEVRGDIVRPIIGFRREELRRLLREQNVQWREDASNSDTRYARNKIRCQLIPWLKDNLNPNFETVMTGLAKQLDQELAEREERTAANLEKVRAFVAPAMACWLPSALVFFSDTEILDLLRMQGAELGLPTLSRDRTLKLLALVRRGGCWRFQWARDVEVCYSNRGMGWLHRDDIDRSRGKNNEKHLGPWWAA